ncbi:malto-oligosyltrehalose synthase [Xylophilus sp. GOD-11R]|uniref:malto-oligosyltrehalose synthase n=1 Tax=Xylophilus sp. GOD-11R TaxID=3089814 RepID=UPI00298C195D|nr:malto-oligosyltrehalose synthase [Xylophilus sp. GOD-11R]WPB55322.1 malto-oligosyltrehalose synthase [Xylophilus sp. GOD-11R]
MSDSTNPADSQPPLGSTDDRQALHALSSQVGLAPSYQDFFGATRDVPDATLRSALHAMGIPAADDEQVRSSLESHQGAAEQQSLPPVVVLREGAAPYGVVLSPGTPDGSAWRLTLESGTVQELHSHTGGNGKPYAVLPEGLPLGYHRLEGPSADDGYCTVIVTPIRCWIPPPLQTGERWWGPCVQLYALRSVRNWGIGDFSDLRVLVEAMAQQGASFVGLNPLHALFPHRPEVASPYSPSSRNMLNPVYLDVEAVPEYQECDAARRLVDSEEFQRRLQQLRATEMVDYAQVAANKLGVLELLWTHFRQQHLGDTTSPRGEAFHAFLSARGEGLRSHALFEALQAHFFALDPTTWGWPAWPDEYRDPHAETVAAFARENEERVGFFAWLQWLAELQLQGVQQRALSIGMGLGLYRDLAVGVNEGGSETWTEPASYALGMHVGAPPDALNALGQNWGLPPLNPTRLMAGRYQTFIETLRANMRNAGALRLDHVMGLMRLFWISPEGGSYVSYPLDDMLGVLALESHRHRCMVVGEDLGNVAPRMREAMHERALLSYRPLFFERAGDGAFRPPQEWPQEALAVVSTHDLPTLRGFWSGDDIELQASLKLYPSAEAHAQQVLARSGDRVQLLLALDRENLLPPGVTVHTTSLPESTPAFTDAVYAFLARSPALLVGVQLEDVTQQLLQVNVPGTGEDVFPNWRRKLSVEVDDLAADPRMLSVAAVLRARRTGPAPRALVGQNELPSLDTANVPLSTYRVQFHAGFTFDQATAVVPYLHAMGISHLYASPYLKARAGSTHGYDIVDHNALNPEVGDEAQFDRMCQTLREHGMRQMLDIVPNHMGVLEADNAWWLDVLENGPAAVHASFFDIEWEPAAPEMAGRVLLPVLGDHYGRVLEAGDLKLTFEPAAGEFWLHYYDHRFPIDPRDYPAIFAVLPIPAPQNEEQRDAQAVVQSLLHAFGNLPPRDDLSDPGREARERDRPLHKRSLARLAQRQPWLDGWIQGCLKTINGNPEVPESFDALDALVRRQAYRLAYWRVAGDDINYRRFFDVNTLAGMRMERDEVFEATHRRILRWLRSDRVSALRIDHPDGLVDPRDYFERLQGRYAAQADTAGRQRRSLYLVVEKILDIDEDLPAEWPVHGGTGYRFSGLVNGLFVDGRNEAAFDSLYRDFTGEYERFGDILFDAKIHVIENGLSSELGWLTETLYRITRSDRRTCDFTRNRLRRALMVVAACHPVYRTYIRSQDDGISHADRAVIERATASARRRSEGEELTVIDHLRGVLLTACEIEDPARRAAVMRFVGRWQQFTAPVTAKAMEDTAFYRYNRLVSLNDVGGDPRRFGTSPAHFHAVNGDDSAHRPHWLLGTSTHDSKRSEDLRTRLDVLSEMPDAWGAVIERWSAQADSLHAVVDGAPAPSRNDEYLLWQTLVGAWPLGGLKPENTEDLVKRVQAYMLKAVREAKQHTSWLNPNEAYEKALAGYVDGIFDRAQSGGLLDDIEGFVDHVAPYGCINSLSLVALKLTSPGVPDIYYGCEQWNFSLVDPDNRRPMDFDRLKDTLGQLAALYADGFPTAAQWQELRQNWTDGRIKHLVTWRLLQLRKAHPEVFRSGGYRPLEGEGAHGSRLVAFARGEGEQTVVTVAARLLRGVTEQLPPDCEGMARLWQDTRLPMPAGETGTTWVDWFTGAPAELAPATPGGPALHVGQALQMLPVAVLVPADWLTPR